MISIIQTPVKLVFLILICLIGLPPETAKKKPPITITVQEHITVSDDSVEVLPPIELNVSEDISVDDDGK